MAGSATQPSCFDKAVELLSLRPHFESELCRKLDQRRYLGEEIAATLDRLRELGYLDDAGCATDYVRARIRRGPLGRRRLLMDLLRRGVSSELANRTLALLSDSVLSESSERQRARAAADAFAARRRTVSDDALGRHLDRKGFEKSVILGVLEERQASLENRRFGERAAAETAAADQATAVGGAARNAPVDPLTKPRGGRMGQHTTADSDN